MVPSMQQTRTRSGALSPGPGCYSPGAQETAVLLGFFAPIARRAGGDGGKIAGMRIEYLSDHARQQLAATNQQLQTAAADLSVRQQERRRAADELAAARRAKPLWKRVLAVSTPEETGPRARVAAARQEVRQANSNVVGVQNRAQQQAAGVQGEDSLMWGLTSLSDEWVMLRGYRNRRGETDHLLVGPLGVWAIEVKRRAVRVHAVGDKWWYEKLDRWGNVVEKGWATDKKGRSWARQVTDVADDLGAWLKKNGHPVQIRTAVVIMHERARVGRHEQLTVDLLATGPEYVIAAMKARSSPLSPHECSEIIKLVRRDHRFHNEKRRQR